MSDKVVVIIGTAERDKALTGAMYAVNARKHGWLADVRLVFFGPSESLLTGDEDLQEMVREFHRLEGQALACRFLADRSGDSEDLAALGVEVVYVGATISNLIRDGYVPMVW